MNSIFFYTDTARLDSQNPTFAFGPVASQETTRYRICNLHAASTDVPAYAVCRGFKGVGGYDHSQAPCMCVTGTSWHSGNHQYLHTAQSILDDFHKGSDGKLSVEQAARNGGQAQKEIFKEQGCDPKCIEAQVINGHKKMGIDKDAKVKHVSIAEQEKYSDRLMDVLDNKAIP